MILFDHASTSQESRVFAVFPGRAVVLSGFGFSKKQNVVAEGKPIQSQKAIIMKLSFDGSVFPEGCTCEGELPDLSGIVRYQYVEDVTSCGLWHLSACQNLRILSVPGTYRLRLNDPGAIGNVTVILNEYLNSELGYQPPNMYFD